jgi:hypothetical protein
VATFGPFYPPLLQDAVNHAERMVTMIERTPVPDAADEASAWLVGRAGEIECFVCAVLADWSEARISRGHAFIAINAYLKDLHHDLPRRLGVRRPRCCIAPDEGTALPVSCSSLTAEAPVTPFVRLLPQWTTPRPATPVDSTTKEWNS